ncbi:MAG: dethiobiotin synthase [Acidobacteriota bacterium]
MHGVFVTGTDTGVGKTIVSAALAAARGAGYWKPIQTGSDDDTGTVAQLAGCPVWAKGIRLPDPVSPHLAAQRAGIRIDLGELMAMCPTLEAEWLDAEWIVEGAGGVLVPINESETMLDVMAALSLPVIVAARATLGTINHTLLTLAAIRDRGLSIEQVVMVGDQNPDNRKAIEHYGGVQVKELPWLNPLNPETLRRHPL